MSGIVARSAHWQSAGSGGVPAFGGASREFDGNDDIEVVSTDYAFTESDTFSVAANVKLGSETFERGFVGTGSYNLHTSGWYMRVRNTGQIRFIMGYDSANFIYRDSDSAISLDQWINLIATFDNGSITIYVDGVMQTSSGGSQGYRTILQSSTLYIGSPRGTNFWLGFLSNIRIYDDILTAGEIATLSGGGHVASRLVGWWLLDSDDVLDYSGNDNHGTNNGSTYSTDGPLD